MDNFNFNTPTKIIFGKDRINDLSKEIKKYGNNILLTYGGGSIKKTGLYDKVIKMLNENGCNVTELGGVQPNPRISHARKGVKLCKENNIDLILAVGGGSTIDESKAIAAGSKYDGDPWDFFIGKAKPPNDATPIGTILTISATGSEMNAGTVMSNEETEDKLSTGAYSLIPKFSLLDPTITYTLPQKQTAAGIVDMFSHISEQYFAATEKAFVTDSISEALYKSCLHYAPVLMKDPENYEARANIMWTGTLALNSILTVGKTYGDWATHKIEHELSAIYDITHGVGLAIITPNWMRHVIKNNPKKFQRYARNVWGIDEKDELKAGNMAIEKTKEFFKSMNMPTTLKEVGIDDARFIEMSKKATRYGEIGAFMKLSDKDVLEILKASLV